MKKQAGFGTVEALLTVAIGLVVFVLLLGGWREYQRNRQQDQFVEVMAREIITLVRRGERAQETSDETVNQASIGPTFANANRVDPFLPNVRRIVGGSIPSGMFSATSGILLYPGVMNSDELSYNATGYYLKAVENRRVGMVLMSLDGANGDAMSHQAMDTSPQALEVLVQRVVALIRQRSSMNGGIFDSATDTLTLAGGGGTLSLPRLGTYIRTPSRGMPQGRSLLVFSDLDAVSPMITHFQRGKRYTTCQVISNMGNVMAPQCPSGMEGVLVFRMCESIGANGGKVFQTAAGPVTIGKGRYEYNDARRVCGGTCDERKPIGSAPAATGYGEPPLHCGFDPSLPGKGCGAIDERRIVEITAPNGVGLPYDPQVAIANRVAKTTISLRNQVIHQDLFYCDARYTLGTTGGYTQNLAHFTVPGNPLTVCCIPEGEREETR